MDRLLLKTSNLGIGNGSYVHSAVTDANGNLTWQQDDGADFNFVVKGNLVSKNLGTGGDLVLANINISNANVSQTMTTSNLVVSNSSSFLGNVIIKSANLFSAGTSIVLGNSVTIAENSATMSLKNATASGNLSVAGNVDAAAVNIGGVDIKARIDNFMRSTTRLYVRTVGSDSNDGTSWERALASIRKAAELAAPGTTIFIETGTYTENNPIRLKPHVAVIGDNLRRTILRALNPQLDYFHVDNLCYLYGLRFVNLKRPAFCVAFPCAIAEATVSGGSVINLDIKYSPSGYTSPPPVIIEAPESSSTAASAVAIVTNGVVTGFSIKSGGSGYTTIPTVSIDAPSSSSGTQAYATAVVTNGVVTDIQIPIGAGGNGYSVVPGVTIDPPTAIVGTTATATAVLTNGVITGFTNLQGGSGYTEVISRPHVSIPSSSKPFIMGSPYIQNCSSITGPFKKSDGQMVDVTQAPYNALPYSLTDIDETGAGGGCRIDGAVCAQAGDVVNGIVLPVDSPLRSFVADSFTQVNQGGPGHLIINRGYAQFVSCFTTFSSYSYRSVAGGLTNISTSVTDFGKYGLVASGYWPDPIASSTISQNYRSSVASVTIATGNGGKGYARAPYVLFDPGENSTAKGTSSLTNDSVTSVQIDSGGIYSGVPGVKFVQNASDVSISIANPAVVSWTNHGLPIGTTVYLTTAGTLPTGLSVNTVYYVLATGYAADSFRLSTAPEGSAIVTTGVQSGVHTMFTAVGLSISSPCVVTWPNHGLVSNSSVSFTTTGTFPTNITANTSYYVMPVGLSTHTFQISATAGGLAINTSGTQSGIHTMTTSQAARGVVSITSPSNIRVNGLTGRKPDYGSVAKLGTKWYTVTGATFVSDGVYDIVFYPQLAAANQSDVLRFYQASQVTTGQHVTEYVGSGVTYNALPEYGGIPNQALETLAISPAKVYYSIADQQGSVRIGPYFKVDQLSGTVTLNTDRFNLSGLGSIGPFKRDGNPVGVELKEVSNDPRLQGSTGVADGYTAPTQLAVKTYVDKVSIPDGGTINQALVKSSDNSYVTTWKSVVLTSNVNQPNGVPSLDSSSRIVGNGSIIYGINAANISSGTLDSARLSNIIGTSSTFYNGFGTNLVALNANNIASGTLSNSRLPATIGTESTAFVGNASGLSSVPASNITPKTGTGNVVLDIAPTLQGNVSAAGNVIVTGNVRVDKCLYMNNQVNNNVICLYGDTNPTSTNVYGFGVNASALRYNSSIEHKWYSNATNTMTLDSAGGLSASGFYTTADSNNYLTQGGLYLRGTTPTVYFRDTDHNSSMIHCNANVLYFLRGANDTTTWSQIGGQWPMYLNLSNNDCVVGGNISAVGDVTAAASDARLKTNVAPIGGAVDKVRRLRGVTFEWDPDGPQPMRGRDVGLIAQDVVQVLPEAVKMAPFDTDESGTSKSGENYLTIDSGNKLVALLVEAVKELADEVAALKRHSNTG